MGYFKSIIFCLAVTCVFVRADAQKDFHVTFGLFKIESDFESKLIQEDVSTIDLLDMKKNHVFGYEIVPPDELEYEVYSIDYLPAEPETLSGALSGKSTADFAKGIKSPTVIAKGISYSSFQFDRGDPLGEYRIEVYINQKLNKVIKFYVTAKKL